MFTTIRRLVLVVALGSATTFSFSAALQDQKLDRAIEGVWCTSVDEGKSCLGYEEYKNGKITVCGGKTSTGAPALVEGRYNIRGSRSCILITASNEPSMKPGSQICIDILRIDQTSLQFRYASIENMEMQLSPEGGAPDKGMPMYRVPPVQMSCRETGK
jgi:hypothetical protein